jgi:SAM-dependent methyltransferase
MAPPSMIRQPTAKELTHERLGARFEEALTPYDTERRLDILVDEFLAGKLEGCKTLDVGSGLGFFSERLVARGASVTACDIGPRLVEQTRARAGCRAVVADALRLTDTFERGSFDVVLSSECIEHTPAPEEAIGEMLAVLKSGGWLSLSTPNRVWSPVVSLATRLKARPFDGYENFSSWTSIRRAIQTNHARVVAERGLHLFPFQLPLHGLSRWCDARLQWGRSAMINICVLAQKS